MAFPATRHTLIQRLAQGGAPDDWQVFLRDYWGAVCRFARVTGHLTEHDAEDVTSQVFEVILQAHLLQRWSASRSARLRTLICAVVRNILGNRFRNTQGRERIVRDHRGELDRYLCDGEPEDASPEVLDAFSTAWAEHLVYAAVESVMRDYHAANKADYFRVLYGRLCESLTMSEIARALGISVATADNYFRHSHHRLGVRLEELVKSHVSRYCPAEELDAEFQREWHELSQSLQRGGGLESAVRSIYAEGPPSYRHPCLDDSLDRPPL